MQHGIAAIGTNEDTNGSPTRKGMYHMPKTLQPVAINVHNGLAVLSDKEIGRMRMNIDLSHLTPEEAIEVLPKS